jgi:hypothetical protein
MLPVWLFPQAADERVGKPFVDGPCLVNLVGLEGP